MITELTMMDITDTISQSDGLMRVVMFYGTTCGPCKNTMPHYEYIANYYTENKSPILFYKIDAWSPEEQRDFCKTTWGQFGVPHFKVFVFDKMVGSRSGAADLARMFQFIQNTIDITNTQFAVQKQEKV